MKENMYAKAVFICGIVIILFGVFAGIFVMSQSGAYSGLDGVYYETGLLIWEGFGVIISSVIIGILFFGFSEIIKLLQGIYNQNDPDFVLKEESNATEGVRVEKVEISPESVTASNKDIIVDFYAEKGLTVDKIESTYNTDFYLVTVNGQKELVELGGFKPIIHGTKD